jgi:uncharacterized protein (DUF362 family)
MTVKKGYRRNLVLFGVASLLWLIFRTGTKPSRIVYPCQRAALATSSALLSSLVPVGLFVALAKSKGFMFEKGPTLMMVVVMAAAAVGGTQFSSSQQFDATAVNPNQEIRLVLESKNATAFPASSIYVVNGRQSAHISELLNLMGGNGLFFYKSENIGVSQGPEGLIANDDVVLIKVNEQWAFRGGTNTDIVKELIQAIVDHPDGFVGEIVVADNGQGYGRMNWPQSNAENTSQSMQGVVDMFSSSYNVSTYDWQNIMYTKVSEYSEGDSADGYIVYDAPDAETGIYVSYPKFKTQYGTCVSFKYGVWNGTEYERQLKVINVPVLKSHGSYAVTASLKHYMGVQSEPLANGHDTVGTGGMGTLMVETGLPILNIIDAIWINANPPVTSWEGPATPYNAATRVNVLMASTDPVALDWWAARHVLIKTASLIGYTVPAGWEYAFHRWLNLTKNEILVGSYDVTSDENRMNVYVRQVQHFADLNGDGVINIADMSIVATAFRSSRGDANWNDEADLDQNGVINIVDIAMVAKEFGT